MKHKKVISRKLLPTRPPTLIMLIWILYNHDYVVPQWGVGIGWFMIGLLWADWLMNLWREDETEISL